MPSQHFLGTSKGKLKRVECFQFWLLVLSNKLRLQNSAFRMKHRICACGGVLLQEIVDTSQLGVSVELTRIW